MPNLNKVTIMGHLCRDAEMRYTNGGDPVTNMTVAVNRDYGDDTDFFDVTIWNQGNYKLAEYRANDNKGDLVLIVGELRQEQWEDSDGNNRSKIKIRADKAINFSQKKGDGGGQEDIEEEVEEDEFEDIPF